MKISTIALFSTVLATALVLTGCSTPPGGMGMDHSATQSADPSSTTEFNDPDIAFATNMIAHHQQAIEMADLVLGKTGVDERVIQLAQDIKAAQGPEIDTMTAWLQDWGRSSTGMDGMTHDGMMSDDDMAALQAASGSDASRLFLEQMTQHHQGAIAMAQDELDTGKNPDALTLAQKIIDAQTAEIATMQDILAAL